MDEIESGDYVDYRISFNDAGAYGFEEGSGYVQAVGPETILIRNGNRVVSAVRSECRMRAKQTRLEI